jgi:hypothetical protein
VGGGAGGVGKGKRKRVVDDDPGYRPKGGSSRPTKKKRKSEGGEGTPTAAKGPRKSGPASWSDLHPGYEKGSGAKGPRKSSMPWAGRRDED